MAGYDQYRDSNRVVWTVAPPDGSSWYMIAYVKDDAEIAYDPAPSDIMASTPPLNEYGHAAPPPTPDQARAIFLKLTGKIEEYARQNRSKVTLRVAAHNDSGWMVVVGIILLAMLDDR